MGKNEEIATRYAPLSEGARSAFLAACIEHVAGAFDRVIGLESAVRTECVDAALVLLRTPAPEGQEQVRTTLIESCKRLGDDANENGELDAEALVLACRSAIEAIGDDAQWKRVIANLDEVIDISAPDPHLGLEEERGWRLRVLEAVEREDHAAIAPLIAQPLDWERRFKESYA